MNFVVFFGCVAIRMGATLSTQLCCVDGKRVLASTLRWMLALFDGTFIRQQKRKAAELLCTLVYVG